MTERQYYLWLRLIPDIGPRGRRNLLRMFGTARNIYYAEEKILLSDEAGRAGKKAAAWRREQAGDMEEIVFSYEARLAEKNITYVALCDETYPKLLSNIYDPPVVLFCKGKTEWLQTDMAIGIVGARSPSVYGREAAGFFAGRLAAEGITVVSGLASGIDAEAHKGAIRANGRTIGVLGSGINLCYPKSSYNLYEEMSKEQLVISENGLDEAPLSFYFPLRNRIISGLSKGVLVVEARKKSGSLITADQALEQGRNVYAVPGRAFDKLSEGTNHLIKMGAALADTPEDILQDILPESEGKTDIRKDIFENSLENELAPLEKIVYSGLSLEPVYIDDIILMTKYPVTDVLHALFSLEKKGLIKQPAKGYYTVFI